MGAGPRDNQIAVDASLVQSSTALANFTHLALESSADQLRENIEAGMNDLDDVNIKVTDVNVVRSGPRQADDVVENDVEPREQDHANNQTSAYAGDDDAEQGSPSFFSGISVQDVLRYLAGMLGGVILVICTFFACVCLCHRRPSEEAGLARHLRRNEGENFDDDNPEDPPGEDGPLDDETGSEAESAQQQQSKPWSPTLPGSPRQVGEAAPGPAMGMSIQGAEMKKDPKYQQQKAEFDYLRTTRDMGFTEGEARAVLLEEEGDYAAAVDKLTQMLEIDPTLARQ